MKKTVTFWSMALYLSVMIFTVPSVSNARHKSVIGTNIDNEKRMYDIKPYSLFNRSDFSDADLNKEIKDVIYLKLNKHVLRQIMDSGDKLISIDVPLNDGTIKQIALSNFNILDEEFKVYERGADGVKKEAKVEIGQYYRGIIEGSENSLAGFAFENNQMAAVFSTLDDGNYNLVLNYRSPGSDNENYILFKEKDIINIAGFKCGVDESFSAIMPTDESLQGKKAFDNCQKLRVSMQGDYKLFQKKNYSLANSVNYVTAVFNMNALLFGNEGIIAVLSEVVINTAPDGYTYETASKVLNRFAQVTQSNFTGDIAQMVTGYQNANNIANLGGLAFLDVLCNPPSMAISASGDTTWSGPFSMANTYMLNNIPNVPVYSWDVMVSTHEMGHNIGSRHTQHCSWPGGAIDGCVASEGSCPDGPLPAQNEGTIMSYCHLNNAVGVGFAHGFGPLPGDKIRGKIATKPCLLSFRPDNTLTVANTERIANRQCYDGQWTYFYYDNNTASESDDELLLMLDAGSQDIGDLDVSGMEVKMTTQNYGNNTGREVTAPYGTGWRELNRAWSVTLPATVTQPAAAVGVRFPYTAQDVADIKGTYADATETTLKVVSFNNQTAANNPSAALTSDVNFYHYSADTATSSQWKKGIIGNYNYAEFVTNTGIFGGSMGFMGGETGTGIESVKATGILVIYPNPATTLLNVQMPRNLPSNKSDIVVIDNLGRVLNAKTNYTVSGGIVVDISGLGAGVYCIRLMNNGQGFNGYFVKK